MVIHTHRMARLIAAAAIAVVMEACTFPEVPIDPGPPQMVVHAVLDPSRDVQLVQVSFTDGSYQNGGIPSTTATVTTPDGVVMTASNGQVRLSDYGVTLAPGATYALRVTSLAGHLVTGTTTIPNAPAVSLTPPIESFTRSSDSLRVTAPLVDGAASFELNLNTVFNGGQDGFSDNVYHTFGNGTVTLAGTARSPLEDEPMFVAGRRTVVVLCAVDSNYYEYYRVLSDPFAGAAPSRLSGGLGVFGSIVPIVVRRLDVR